MIKIKEFLTPRGLYKTGIGFSVLLLLLAFFVFESRAVEPNGPLVHDMDNVLSEEEMAKLGEILKENWKESKEKVVVVTSGEELPAIEELKDIISQIKGEHNYGVYSDNIYGSFYFFLNRKQGADEYNGFEVIPTDWLEPELTNYQVSHIKRELTAKANGQADVISLVTDFLELIKVYHYPVINELGIGVLQDEEIIKASVEANRWRKKYEQNIVLLLNKGLTEELYQKYKEDYFLSQGYGVGEKESGVFVLYDEARSKFDVMFYGTASKNYTNEQLNAMTEEMEDAFAKKDIFRVVVAVERLLEPEEKLPLGEHEDSSEVEEADDGKQGFYDEDEIIGREAIEKIDRMAWSINKLLTVDFVTYVYDGTKPDADAKKEKAFNEIALRDKVMVSFDTIRKEMAVDYSLGEKYTEIMPKLDVVKEHLERNMHFSYDSDSILNFQEYFARFFHYVVNKNLYDDVFVDERKEVFDIRRITEWNRRLNVLAEERNLQFAIFMMRDAKEQMPTEIWSKDMAAYLQEAFEGREVLMLRYNAMENTADITYHGENRDLGQMVDKVFSPAVQNAISISTPEKVVDVFVEVLESNLGKHIEEDRPVNEIITDSFEESVLKISYNIVGIVLVLIFVILFFLIGFITLIIVLIKRKNKKRSNHMQGYGQVPFTMPPNYGQSGYPQNYPNSPNLQPNYPVYQPNYTGNPDIRSPQNIPHPNYPQANYGISPNYPVNEVPANYQANSVNSVGNEMQNGISQGNPPQTETFFTEESLTQEKRAENFYVEGEAQQGKETNNFS